MADPSSTPATRRGHSSVALRSGTAALPGRLEVPVEVAPGYHLRWDPALPYRCGPLTLPEGVDPAMWDRIAAVTHPPWLRLAAATVLDRQLYVPLDRSLLDAEIAAARLGSARTLNPGDTARESLLRQALVGARCASDGVVRYLARLADDERRPPRALAAALDPVMRAYADLVAEVREFDGVLTSVGEAWQRVTELPPGGRHGRAAGATPPLVASAVPGSAFVDPRAVRARVLRLGPTPDFAEIAVEAVRSDPDAAVRVRVRVPAFPPASGRVEPADIAVRLIDRRSGMTHGYGVLEWSAPSDGSACYEAVVSLPAALSAADVSVDVFEMSANPLPVERGTVHEVRRATLFQTAWRALVADVRLTGARAEPAARLCAIVGRIAGDGLTGAEEPLWSGGPTRAQLMEVVELGDEALLGRLRTAPSVGGRATGSDRIVEAVSGPGDLLAAEVAAAHERARTAA